MTTPRAESALLSRLNTSILRNGCVVAVNAPLPHTNFIVNIRNISQLGRVRVRETEFTGNANGFPTGACCVQPAPAPISYSRGGMGEAQGDPPRHFRRSARRGERMPNGSAGPLQLTHPAYFFSFGKTRATRPTGPPRPGALGYRKT